MKRWAGMELVQEKEEEARRLRERLMQRMEEQTSRARAAVLEEQRVRQQLQADFEYNLRLLEERDRELERYESAIAELRAVVNGLTAEASELKVQLAEASSAVAREKEAQQELEEHHRSRVEQLRSELEAFRHAKSKEVEEERKRMESVRRELGRRLVEVEGEVGRVREEVTAQFEQASQRKDHDHQMKVEELSSALLQSQCQVRQVSRELEAARRTQETCKEDTICLRERVSELEHQLHSQQCVWQDQLEAKDTEMQELKSSLEHMTAALAASQEDFQRRHSELDQRVREKGLCLQVAKEAHQEREAELLGRVREVESELGRREEEVGRLQQRHEEELMERDRQCASLQHHLVECRRECEVQVREVGKEMVQKDSQLLQMRDTVDKLQKELEQVTSDLQQAHQELCSSVSREKALEAGRAQLELEWRERASEAERKATSRAQQVVRQLAQAKEEAAAELQVAHDQLSQQQAVMEGVARERDVAMATLHSNNLHQQFLHELQQHQEHHGYMTNHSVSGSGHVTTSPSELHQQNEQLRAVIAGMRQEMEQLSASHTADHSGSVEGVVLSRGYVKYLEQELVRVTTENRQYRAREAPGQNMRSSGKPPTPPPHHDNQPGPSSPSARHRSHLVALSDTIAALQREKTALELKGVWLEGRVRDLEGMLKQVQEEAYQLKALHTPPHKCQLKLLQATRTIISLVRERERLVGSLQARGREERERVGGGKGVRQGETAPVEGGREYSQETQDVVAESRREGRQEREGEGRDQVETSKNLVGQSESVRTAQSSSVWEERTPSTCTHTSPPPQPQLPPPQPQLPPSQSQLPPSQLTHEHNESSGGPQSVLPWQPEPPDPSLLSLHFSDSEVEGQRSLERVLMDGSLTSTPHPSPEHHETGGGGSGDGVRGDGVMEMRGRGVVRHPRPVSHRPQSIQARQGTAGPQAKQGTTGPQTRRGTTGPQARRGTTGPQAKVRNYTIRTE